MLQLFFNKKNSTAISLLHALFFTSTKSICVCEHLVVTVRVHFSNNSTNKSLPNLCSALVQLLLVLQLIVVDYVVILDVSLLLTFGHRIKINISELFLDSLIIQGLIKKYVVTICKMT